jgi:hypothetical protein
MMLRLMCHHNMQSPLSCGSFGPFTSVYEFVYIQTCWQAGSPCLLDATYRKLSIFIPSPFGSISIQCDYIGPPYPQYQFNKAGARQKKKEEKKKRLLRVL